MKLLASLLAPDSASGVHRMEEREPLPWREVVHVRAENCLDVARSCIRRWPGKPPCVVVFGAKEGPTAKLSQMDQSSDILQRSDLKDKMKEDVPGRPLHKLGGLYHSDVCVNADEDSLGFSVAMLYVVDSRRVPEEDDASFEARVWPEMREKCRNVLRICHEFGHEVLGAWGRGWRRFLPAGKVACCWDDVLREPEFVGRFEQILFAVPGHSHGAFLKVFGAATSTVSRRAPAARPSQG